MPAPAATSSYRQVARAADGALQSAGPEGEEEPGWSSGSAWRHMCVFAHTSGKSINMLFKSSTDKLVRKTAQVKENYGNKF